MSDPVAAVSNQLSSLSMRDGSTRSSKVNGHSGTQSRTYAEYEEDEVRAPRERLDSHDSATSASSSNSGDSAISTTSSDEYDEEHLADLETAKAVRKYSQRMVFLTRRQFEAFCANLERKKRNASTSHSQTRRAYSGI